MPSSRAAGCTAKGTRTGSIGEKRRSSKPGPGLISSLRMRGPRCATLLPAPCQGFACVKLSSIIGIHSSASVAQANQRNALVAWPESQPNLGARRKSAAPFDLQFTRRRVCPGPARSAATPRARINATALRTRKSGTIAPGLNRRTEPAQSGS